MSSACPDRSLITHPQLTGILLPGLQSHQPIAGRCPQLQEQWPGITFCPSKDHRYAACEATPIDDGGGDPCGTFGRGWRPVIRGPPDMPRVADDVRLARPRRHSMAG